MADITLRMRKMSEIYRMKVLTDNGDFFGEVEEAIISPNKIQGWRIKAVKNSILTKVLGDAKGVVVPHQLVKSVGDVMIVSRNAIPSMSEPEE